MKQRLLLILFFLLAFALRAYSAIEPVRFFYSDTCSHCHEMKPFMEKLVELNPDADIKLINRDMETEEWEKSCADAGIPAWGVPRLFIGNSSFAGWFVNGSGLIYAEEYHGYIGYRSEIIRSLDENFDHTLRFPDTY